MGRIWARGVCRDGGSVKRWVFGGMTHSFDEVGAQRLAIEQGPTVIQKEFAVVPVVDRVAEIHIGDDRQSALPGGFNLADGFVKIRFRSGCHDRVGAGLSQGDRNGASDAHASAGDDGHLIGDVKIIKDHRFSFDMAASGRPAIRGSPACERQTMRQYPSLWVSCGGCSSGRPAVLKEIALKSCEKGVAAV
ncbi:hypothetical protein [Mycobacterium sp. MUNTM1]